MTGLAEMYRDGCSPRRSAAWAFGLPIGRGFGPILASKRLAAYPAGAPGRCERTLDKQEIQTFGAPSRDAAAEIERLHNRSPAAFQRQDAG